MLSRIAFSSVRNFAKPLGASFGQVCRTSSTASPTPTKSPGASSGGTVEEFTWYAKSGTKFPWEGPERDVVNFPRPVQPEYPDKIRMLFIPDRWFQFFYNKTGVTGPYMLGFGIYMYVLSKEFWIMDHEYQYVYVGFLLLTLIREKFGDGIAAWADKAVDKDNADLESYTTVQIKNLEDEIENEKKLQFQSEGEKLLIDAKRENVAMQAEAAYRERAMIVYNEVKKRLEFHSQKQLMERRVAHKHMCDWVVAQVLKSITPQQETESLQKCIVDLQAMSSKA